MRSHIVLRLASVSIALAAVPGVAATQQLAGGVIVTPYMGVYVPTNDFAKVGVTTSGQAVTGNIKHQAALVSGLNLSYWMTDRLGIEGGAAYTKSGVTGSLLVPSAGGTIQRNGSQYAHVWLGSAKLMMQLMPRESEFNLRLGVGPAIISRAGKAYAGNFEGKMTGATDIGAALSLCSRIPVASNIGLRLRAEDYMYSGKLGYESATTGVDNFKFNSRFQNDLVFSAGLQLLLNK